MAAAALDEADERALAIAEHVQGQLAIARSLARIAASVLRDRALETMSSLTQAAMIEWRQVMRVARATAQAATHATVAAEARRQRAHRESARSAHAMDPSETCGGAHLR
ncbi:MAG: hypothetical protein FWD73_10620 [Polyangiaceae bacterium]|nr:hypothetical protein [Polyangiaceae bacterium]